MGGVDAAKQAMEGALNKGLDRAVEISRPVVLKHIAQSRRQRPDANPEEIITVLGRRFTATVASTGTLAGATAAAPGIGTPASVALALGDAGGFTGVAALYVFALSEIYDVRVDELERRRTLLLGVLLGDVGADAMKVVVGRTGPHWARHAVKAVPAEAIKRANRVLGRNFVTRYGTRQGVFVLGKQAPIGIGAAIGGVGNAAFARVTIRSAKRAFGPAPAQWPAHLTATHQAETPIDAVGAVARAALEGPSDH